MKQLTLVEVQQEALKILKAFHNYCVENNLRYQLAYGTCLGAVRHNGFIPWDDDVDVMMPRSDFDKLQKLIVTKPIPSLEFLSIDTNSEYTSALAKVHNPQTLALQHYHQLDRPRFGVYIDVFVIDGLPSDQKSIEDVFKKANFARRCWGFSVDNWSYEKRIFVRVLKTTFALPFKWVGYRHWLRRYDRICRSNQFECTDKAGIIQFGEGIKKEVFNRSIFEHSKLARFEDAEFFIPEQYDIYLKQMYGDYMQLPPKNQRISKHGTDFYAYPANQYNG